MTKVTHINKIAFQLQLHNWIVKVLVTAGPTPNKGKPTPYESSKLLQVDASALFPQIHPEVKIIPYQMTKL